jgi:predicted 3-demethylubiquinone-9 3-methyltransferase (glyoxalase superfamily)
MQNISPCLWFDDQAEAAAHFYVSVFKNSRILRTTHYLEGMPKPAGSVLTVQFVLDGEAFVALNGGPQYAFTPAVSFMVTCETQAEVDDLWWKLTAGGEEGPCGWLKDKFGVSWQVVPRPVLEWLSGPDRAASQRAAQAMFHMKKLDLAILRRAYDQA